MAKGRELIGEGLLCVVAVYPKQPRTARIAAHISSGFPSSHFQGIEYLMPRLCVTPTFALGMHHAEPGLFLLLVISDGRQEKSLLTTTVDSLGDPSHISEMVNTLA